MALREASFVATLMVSVVADCDAASLPPGPYGCYAYNPKPNFVGEIAIAGPRYAVAHFGADGTYDYDAKSGQVAFKGMPPMGFEAAVLETDSTSGRRVLRMYPKASDIGNRAKAAVCSPKDNVTAVPPGARLAMTTLKAGDRVTAEFIGVPYPATVLAVESARVRVRYDQPKSTDEWVDATKVRPRK